MDAERFRWGASIEEETKHLNLKALTKVLQSVTSYRSSNGQSRKEAYKFIASQDELTQRRIYDDFQGLLANPTSETCKAKWMLKRRLDDEDAKIRDVRARLDDIESNLRRHCKKGIDC
jgi:hypothetical protein